MQIQKLISLPPGMVSHFHPLEGKDTGQWYCDSDPIDKKVGSGGGTAAVLASAYRADRFAGTFSGTFAEWLLQKKRMVIHSGGESRRLPAYAPCGKSLLPMPVFRWSKGQYMDQKLLDFQVSYYEKILKRAPDGYTTLVGSGDVMFISGDRFNDLPQADVLIFGIWVDDEVASRHGVFFSPRKQQTQLAFVAQKPTREALGAYAKDYFYLMDSGIVLMNASTTQKLMKKSGWDENRESFIGETPHFYDLYGEMLTSFGTEAKDPDPELAGLDVRLVPLTEGAFYHFGSNRDLIESTLKLQNRVTDQRLKYTPEADHHPSIFQQNSKVGFKFTESNHHLWIENSHVPGTWQLFHHHIITGVPENHWNLELPEGICMDVVHLNDDRFCLRLYGFDDGFRDSIDEEVVWMGKPVKDWLEERSVDAGAAGIHFGDSIFELPLFPVVGKDEIPAMVIWMVRGGGIDSDWQAAERLSARELSERSNPVSLYSQREKLKAYSLTELARNHHKSIFYYMDLERCAADFRILGLDLPGEIPAGESIVKQISDHMFRARVSEDPSISGVHEMQAFGILREEMIDTLRSQRIDPVRNVLDDQILWGRSPVRLDLAGGWTDTPPYCILEGGKVVNLSVELNGQLPLQVFARPLAEPKIVLRSIDLGEKVEINSFDELKGYNRVGGGFSIPMAALVLAGFGPGFSKKEYPGLPEQLKAFGCGIEMSLLAAIPKGSGLGTSSNLAATVLGTLSEFCGLNWDKHEVAYRTLILEQMLTSGGGWQDQYGGIFPGVKLLETSPGILQKPSIKWLSDQLFSNRETSEMMLLYYTGVTRVARDILSEIVKGMFLNSSRHLAIFSEMQEHARETFETILRNDYFGVAARVAHSWDLNQRLDEGTNPPVIREITGMVDDLLLGYKLLGAGGGGYLLMFAKSAEAAIKAKRLLESKPPNNRARFVDFRVSKTGFQVSRS
ncbi:MAG: bifunctional fucokinase/fucose-1-phosphate guanylyltransferase [Bacteroidales bacterium]